MKLYISRIFLGIFLVSSQWILAQALSRHQFSVKGKCEMCKTRIESTALKAGAKQAVYSIDSQTLTLETDNSTSTDNILQKVAEAGHDNEKFKATPAAYEALPACCHYDRDSGALQTTAEQNEHSTKKENEFFVRGNCESCKARIEKAAKEAGARSAEWNAESQKLTLDFDPATTSSDKILRKIADAGHDNEKYRAADAVYKNLPSCCLYDRNIPFGEVNPKVHAEEGTNPSHAQHSLSETEGKTIEGVTVIGSKAATSLNKKEAGMVFNIDRKELLKAACCNLSESFETNATVDVSFSNAVTGTKQLKMLGLDQKYTSLTKELLPEIRGLASAYGLSFIPGRWIEGIQLTKGGSTVTNGYESITGQINTELLKNAAKPETSLNLFADFNGRTEANITSVSKINDQWSQTFLLHGNGTFGNTDMNKDGFLDRPKGTQINAAYLLNYNDLEKSGFGSHFGINFIKDERTSGQTDFNKNISQDKQSANGVGIDISRFQVWNKTGYVFKGKPYQSLGWMNQYTYHQQDSFFGLRNYSGKQHTYYSNLIFESILGNTNHKYKAGASFMYDGYDETYLTDQFKRNEIVPGVFAEYTLTGLKYTLVAGARVDFHNLAGTQFTPRMNFKYDITPQTILRLSAGRGFRTANVFAENQQYFASNRMVQIMQNGGNIYGLKPEIAWNYGASLQQEFKLFGRKSSVVADFFRTDFKDQVLVDLDRSPQQLTFYNLEGKSFANSFQTQWDFIPLKNFEVRLAYKYYDVQADYLEGRREVPFMARHRGFLNLAYATNKNTKGGFWSFDTTLNWIGKQRLPETSSNPQEFRLPAYSESYAVLNAQISRNFNPKIRAYLGGENLTSYYQKNAIVDFRNPFGNYFDGGMVYAPIMKANFYVGLDVTF
ncbi:MULTISPECIES: TonB-dependent receptor domain-containing protein [Chryseobacterium]|uniref:Outer membrane receptor for ferrienterochelin and colicins n=1 Tax=Chryseobacterium camelliae TaxID=1265445 RepID=A0ABU0TN23_9FLAO|nr:MULTISPECIES: TonB-dependent receptor [Chryseobacterium]MDT3407704.1 outer membrane receptor for ferrienterochelin and colicins [Pseudacidovorax intermedius]MDQ1098444.1 outer membrane receptor for ferrienterochelin and colicins [Chryseobacterium camelliae]MDQ1102368.1 outer membrane receptor for ferrienterochelin and colicins [Chryseobacterium sp. SORGH_AS_1048]MDR6085805.1 outer membrane receptor for ferrienterochelin and colicins [Chryseobacterium sp. SORGH_AS_0909]MDR6130168.1 outer mem